MSCCASAWVRHAHLRKQRPRPLRRNSVESADRAPYTKRARLKSLHSKCPGDFARSTQRVCIAPFEFKKLRPCTFDYLQNTTFPTEQSMSDNHDFVGSSHRYTKSKNIRMRLNNLEARTLHGARKLSTPPSKKTGAQLTSRVMSSTAHASARSRWQSRAGA